MPATARSIDSQWINEEKGFAALAVAKHQAKNPVKAMLAGGIAGGIEICLTYPTEYVKTQLQLAESVHPPKYKGIIDCVRVTVRSHGFFGLYRGLSSLIYGSIPKSAVRFATFEKLSNYRKDHNGKLTSRDGFFCGLGAGLTEAVFVVCPVQTIKVKLIHDRTLERPRYPKSFFRAVAQIVRAEGFQGIYQGLTATMLKQGSNQAIRFFVMTSLRNWYRHDDPDKEIGMLVTAAFGATAGVASVFGNTPLDVIKTRMQGLDAHKYKNTWDCAKKIWKHEGFFGFYKGTLPRLTRVCADVALVFVIYEETMKIFNRAWPD